MTEDKFIDSACYNFFKRIYKEDFNISTKLPNSNLGGIQDYFQLFIEIDTINGTICTSASKPTLEETLLELKYKINKNINDWAELSHIYSTNNLDGVTSTTLSNPKINPKILIFLKQQRVYKYLWNPTKTKNIFTNEYTPLIMSILSNIPITKKNIIKEVNSLV